MEDFSFMSETMRRAVSSKAWRLLDRGWAAYFVTLDFDLAIVSELERKDRMFSVAVSVCETAVGLVLTENYDPGVTEMDEPIWLIGFGLGTSDGEWRRPDKFGDHRGRCCIMALFPPTYSVRNIEGILPQLMHDGEKLDDGGLITRAAYHRLEIGTKRNLTLALGELLTPSGSPVRLAIMEGGAISHFTHEVQSRDAAPAGVYFADLERDELDGAEDSEGGVAND